MIITIAMIMIDIIIVGRIVITVPHEVSGSAGPCLTCGRRVEAYQCGNFGRKY